MSKGIVDIPFTNWSGSSLSGSAESLMKRDQSALHRVKGALHDPYVTRIIKKRVIITG